MVGWKRWFYNIAGWEYDIADEKQKRLKYLLTEQIKNTKKISLKNNKLNSNKINKIKNKKRKKKINKLL